MTTKPPEICEGCATGCMEYLDITHIFDTEDNKLKSKWRAEPCIQVKKRGKLNPARVNYCFNHYER